MHDGQAVQAVSQIALLHEPEEIEYAKSTFSPRWAGFFRCP